MKLNANKIAEMLGGVVEGDDKISINKLSKIEYGDKQSLSFLGNPKYNNFLYTTNASIILVNKDLKLEKPVKSTLIRVEDPNESFSQLLNHFNNKNSKLSGISNNSIIHKSVKFSKDLYFGDFSICEKNSKIGKNVKIHSQVYIGENVLIGNNVIIYPGVKIYADTVIGNNCILHAGCIIGSDGFGFNLDKEGNQIKVSHNGNVVLEDDVEIGANCALDKATLGSTILRRGVKLDNLVMVAHNVEIGQSTVIAGCVGIAGSTIIGKNCMIGGQAGISGHLKIGDRVMIQAKAGVFRNIKSDTSVMGIPAIKYLDYNKSYVHFKNLPSIMKSLNKLFKNSKNA